MKAKTMIGGMLAVAAVTAGGLWKAAVKSQTPKKIPITLTPPMPFEDVTFDSGEVGCMGGSSRPELIFRNHGRS